MLDSSANITAPYQSEGLRSAIGPGRENVDQHLAVFQSLVARADGFLQRRRYDAAAVNAGIAAKYAASHHPGQFASPQLERILLAIGQTITQPHPEANDLLPTTSPQRIMHVLTQVARVGGHSRMIWRWIEQDTARSHSVVLTRQGAVRVPSLLTEAVATAHGQVVVLDERRGTIRKWAAALRDAVASVDLIVLHVNPDDVIPVIAFADGRRVPPVVFVDHADQLFWLGASVSNVVAGLRESGRRLAEARRGIPPEHSALLPIALGPIRRTLSRSEAKARLGLPPDAVVLLSIARPHKYTPLEGHSFLEGLLPVLDSHEETVLLVVGPDDGGPWAEARQRTRGRVRALGVREGTAVLYQAADVYVDSYPIVSITSLLEAGSYGTPLVSRRPDAAEWSVLCADTPGLVKHLISAHDLATYRSAIIRLIEDAALRERLGEQTREGIAAVHTGPDWQRSLEAVYEQAGKVSRLSESPSQRQADQPRVEELDTLLPQLFRDEPALEEIEQFYTRLLPLDLRLSQWVRLLAAKRRFHPGLLLPEWLGTRLERRLYPNGSDSYVSSSDVASRVP